MLIGVATAVKLTPGVFVVHLLVTRRWREAATAVGTAAGVSLAAWVLLPQASFTYWGGALQDPARLGPNAGTANQSMRGLLLRVGGDGAVGTAVWVALVLLVGVLGFALARRYFRAGTRWARSRSSGCSRACCRRWRGCTTTTGWWSWSWRCSATARSRARAGCGPPWG